MITKKTWGAAGALAIAGVLLAGIATPASAATTIPATFAATTDSHGVYGPSGLYWPSATPKLTDSFIYDVTVEPTWAAIQKARDAAPASGNAIIRVKPGTLPAGKGSGSTSVATLSNKDTTRTSKVLIVPLNGYGTVKGAANTAGYSFTLFDTALVGFDFSTQGVLVRNSSDFALGKSTFKVLNITANEADSKNLEFIETVLPASQSANTDSSAVRVANGHKIDGLTFRGAYWSPTYKEAGSSSHTDSLQFSGSGLISNVLIADSLLIQSSNQGIQSEVLASIRFEDTVLVGGQRGLGRYPLKANEATINSANTLWGMASAASAKGLIVMGSINSNYKWTKVENSYVGSATGSTPTAGTFTVESSFTDSKKPQTAWLDKYSPLPTSTYLAKIWKNLGGSTVPPTPTPTAPAPTPTPTTPATPTPTPVKVSPTITVVSPTTATVSGKTVTISVRIKSDSVITASNLVIDGVPGVIALTKSGDVYSTVLDSTKVANGTYALTVLAADADGDKAQQTGSIIVKN